MCAAVGRFLSSRVVACLCAVLGFRVQCSPTVGTSPDVFPHSLRLCNCLHGGILPWTLAANSVVHRQRLCNCTLLQRLCLVHKALSTQQWHHNCLTNPVSIEQESPMCATMYVCSRLRTASTRYRIRCHLYLRLYDCVQVRNTTPTVQWSAPILARDTACIGQAWKSWHGYIGGRVRRVIVYTSTYSQIGS